MDDLLAKPIDQAAVVVLDTETTGLFPAQGHRIVEIGAVRYEPGSDGPWQAVAEFSQLIQPDRRMDPGASRVNGIWDADLLGMPRGALRCTGRSSVDPPLVCSSERPVPFRPARSPLDGIGFPVICDPQRTIANLPVSVTVASAAPSA